MNQNNNTMAINQLTNLSNNNNSYSNIHNNNPNATTMTATNSTNDATIVGLHFKIGKKIGEGSFGVLFEGINMINGVPVAIKFEPRKTEAPQLKDEYRTYKIMAGTPNIPLAYYFGQEGLHNILVIDLLGPSLEDLFDWCGRRFSPKTVVQIAIQMITLLEDLHSHDLIYRDIKPDNFLIGRPGLSDENNIHLIDFGMAKQYRDPKTKQHIPYREKKSLSGTARYMSINTHLGREQSRRDDMEALGHVFFYFLRGQLPWQGLKAPNNKQKYEKIGEKKRTTNVYDLAQGLPIQFGRYLEIIRNLGFDETPDYEGYRKLFLTVLDDMNETYDGVYDWMKLNGGRGWDPNINKKPNLHGYGHPNPVDKNKRHKAGYNNGKLPQIKPQPQPQHATPQPQPQYMNAQQQSQFKNDPNSFQAFQQQSQQRYSQHHLQMNKMQPNPMQQQQKYYQQKMAQKQQPNYTTNSNPNVNGYGPQGHHDQQQTQQLHAQPQIGNQQLHSQPMTQQSVRDDSSEEHKGFFAKLGCC
ncbi:casein kinase I homolog 1 [Monosporozyma servazzii]